MKNLNVFFILFLFFSYSSFGQSCLPNGITFSTQAEIDIFPNLYPNCTEIAGNVKITGTVNNLDSLIQVTSIGGDLFIDSCDVVSLSGLDNLTSIGNYFSIYNNPNLIHLTGLEGLVSVGYVFALRNNYKLSSLNGLNNLQEVGLNFYIGDMDTVIAGYEQFHDLTGLESLTTVGGFYLNLLDNLTNLSGFENLDSVGIKIDIFGNNNLESLAGLEWMTHLNADLHITGNDILTSLNGLENLENLKGQLIIGGNGTLTSLEAIANLNISIITHLVIASNPLLEVCNETSVCDYLNNGGAASIGDNAPGCNTENEILATCLPTCPTDITFSTQAEVDNFPNLYPNCIEIAGNVKITDTVNNLDSLIQIVSIGGNLNIDTCDVLETLVGLENLTTIGGHLNILFNSNLIYLNGLEGLSNVEGQVTVSRNYKLSSLNGLNNLESVGSDFYIGTLDTMIAGYPPFSDLTGLENLTIVGGSFLLYNLDYLTNLSGFENLDSVGFNLYISHNKRLKSLEGLEWMIHFENGITIELNDSLTNLMGLENLESTEKDFNIIGDFQLEDLSALGNLTSIGKSLRVFGSYGLTSLDGFSNLTNVQEIKLQDNPLLTSLSGLENVNTTNLINLQIDTHPLLAICNEPNICDYLANGGVASISNNAPGCNTENEILTTCLPTCPTDITFSTQAEVDDFPNIYPNCTEIAGTVKITGTVNNLDSLIQIISIGGDLKIDTCDVLETLDGLGNLIYVGGNFEIKNNQKIETIAVLNTLDSIGGNLRITNNDTLNLISGFNNLTSIGSIRIGHNKELSSLSGFNSIANVDGFLRIEVNLILTEITAFSNLTHVGGEMLFAPGSQLTDISGFSNLEQVGGKLTLLELLVTDFTTLNNLVSVGGLVIDLNSQLTSLDGLQGLTIIPGELRITQNVTLNNLSGLQNISSVGGDFIIGGNSLLSSLQGLGDVEINTNSSLTIITNPLLEICNESNICKFLSYNGVAYISDNAPGCNSPAEVGLSCVANIPGLTCANPIVLCELDGYSTTLVNVNSQDQPSTFCGSISNNQWFSFVAGSTNMTLDITVGSCIGTSNGTGMQAHVYSECGAPWTAVSNCLFEVLPNSTEALTLDGLTIGNVYYLMTDGWAGDICDFTINVTSGSTAPSSTNSGGDCPDEIDGFITIGEFGNNKYYISNNLSQPVAAQTLAETFGGNLATISSQEENDFIQQNISDMVYIGLNDFDLEGNLVWENGEALTYNNINPCGFCNENSADQDFVIVAPWNGAWSFSNYYNSRKFIMEIPCGCGTTPSTEITLSCPNDINVILQNGATSIEVGFPNPTVSTTCSGGDIFIEQINGNSSGTTFEEGTHIITFEAIDSCGNIENCSFLITIEPEIITGDCPEEIVGFTTLGEFENSKYYLSNDISRATDAQVTAISHGGYLTSISSQAENDFIQQNISEMVYIGLNDYDSEGNLEWYNNEPFTFDNVNPCGFCNENSADQDFVIMAPWNGEWSFSNFYNSRLYVMEIPCGGNNNGSITVDCPSEQNIELQVGSNEGIINYDEVTATTTCPDGGLTITLTSGPAIGESQPIGKYTIIYTITDACGNSTQCLFIVDVVPSSNGGGCPNSLADFTFMGEFGNSSYFISNTEGRPADAQAVAEANGGNLAIINSQAENDFIADQINGLVYIGLDDYQTEGTLAWVDGSGNAFANFNVCNFCNENSEEMDFVVMHSWNGAWSWSNFYNSRKYIVEIPCSSSLNNPSNNFSLTVQVPEEDRKPTLEKLVPNPAMDFIYVEINSAQKMEVELMIYDARGSLVKIQSESLYIGMNTPMIDISELTAGFYSIYIPQAKTRFATERFVKVRD